MRLFQDAAGTIPAYEAGQPIGKVVRAAGTMDVAQVIALSRPTLARWPKGGRRNLLTWTEDFSNADWIKFKQGLGADPVITPGFEAPDGSNTAWRIQLSAGDNGPGDYSLIRQAAGSWPSGGTRSLYVRSNTGANQTVSLVATDPGRRVTVTPVWQRFEQTVSSGARQLDISCGGAALTGATADILIWHPQVEAAPSATSYQRVTTALDVTEAGVPDVWHLWNDGGDSLPAVLPASAYEIAWVTPLGAVSYASVTSDGTTGTDLLRAERVADVLAREGTFTPAEKTALEAYWQQRYAA